jgi:hypothetical protein
VTADGEAKRRAVDAGAFARPSFRADTKQKHKLPRIRTPFRCDVTKDRAIAPVSLQSFVLTVTIRRYLKMTELLQLSTGRCHRGVINELGLGGFGQ